MPAPVCWRSLFTSDAVICNVDIVCSFLNVKSCKLQVARSLPATHNLQLKYYSSVVSAAGAAGVSASAATSATLFLLPPSPGAEGVAGAAGASALGLSAF